LSSGIEPATLLHSSAVSICNIVLVPQAN
jgi:hypothetical protein